MAYRIEPDEPVRDAVVRTIGERIDEALASIDDQQLDEHEAVHDVRKRGKEIRAVLRLVRGVLPPATYHRENRWYRDTARRLSELRDAHAHLETYDALVGAFDGRIDPATYAVIRETLEERRDELVDQLDLDQRLATVRDELEEGRARLDELRLDADGREAFEGGLIRTYARARDRMGDAAERGTTYAFHQWRKRVKYHRSHVELLADVWPEAHRTRIEDLQDLSDLLGDEHDLAELRATVLTEPETFPDGEPTEDFVALIGRQRTRLQREAEPLGTALFEDEPDDVRARYRQATGLAPESSPDPAETGATAGPARD